MIRALYAAFVLTLLAVPGAASSQTHGQPVYLNASAPSLGLVLGLGQRVGAVPSERQHL